MAGFQALDALLAPREATRKAVCQMNSRSSTALSACWFLRD